MIKKATGPFIILFFIVYTSCEKAIVVYPGNNQDLTPLPPDGSISWIIPANDENIGQLDEHSSNISIGTLNAEDPNPDDEFSYELTNFSQYFQIIENSEGEIALQVKSDINFESDQIPASKQFDLIIQVEDDSFEKLSNDFTIRIKIVDLNDNSLQNILNSLEKLYLLDKKCSNNLLENISTFIENTTLDKLTNLIINEHELEKGIELILD